MLPVFFCWDLDVYFPLHAIYGKPPPCVPPSSTYPAIWFPAVAATEIPRLRALFSSGTVSPAPGVHFLPLPRRRPRISGGAFRWTTTCPRAPARGFPRRARRRRASSPPSSAPSLPGLSSTPRPLVEGMGEWRTRLRERYPSWWMPFST